MITLHVNGTSHSLSVVDDMPLLWVLRDILKLTGTKYGCGIASCGACTVHVDGKATRSCVTPVGSLKGKNVTTIEGIHSSIAEAVQSAWIRLNVVQCGYCQSGQIMSAIDLLQKNSRPNDQAISQAMQGNICRCTTYQRIREAIHKAASELN